MDDVQLDLNAILDEMAGKIGSLEKQLTIANATNNSLRAKLAAAQQKESADVVELTPGNRAERRRAERASKKATPAKKAAPVKAVAVPAKP